MSMPLKLVEVTESESLRQILALRVLAWRSFINIDPDLLEGMDKYDTTGRHWAIVDGNRFVAANRIHESLGGSPGVSRTGPERPTRRNSNIDCGIRRLHLRYWTYPCGRQADRSTGEGGV
jgi:hypothetical protein